MPRRPNPRKVRSHGVYTVQELAEALGVHQITIRRWIHQDGLPAVTDRKPWLIDGRDAKQFLESRSRTAKCRLARGELYCLRCRDRRRPDGGLVDYLPNTADFGRLVGFCPACGTTMYRAVRKVDLDELPTDLDLAFPTGETGIASSAAPALNVHFEKEARTHGKTPP